MEEAYRKMLKAQLMEWDTLITLLMEKAENTDPELRHRYTQEFVEIRREQRDAVKMIEKREVANGDTWKNVKTTMVMTCHKLGTGIAQAMVTFK